MHRHIGPFDAIFEVNICWVSDLELAEMVDFDSEVSGRPNDSNNYAVGLTRPTTVLTSLSCL